MKKTNEKWVMEKYPNMTIVFKILVILGLFIVFFPSTSSAGAISDVLNDGTNSEIPDSEIINVLKEYFGFGPHLKNNQGDPYFSDPLMKETLNSDPAMKSQLKELTKEMKQYILMTDADLPAFDISLVHSVDKIDTIKKVSKWLCDYSDLFGKIVRLPTGPLDAACKIKEVIEESEEFRDDQIIPYFAEKIYENYKIERSTNTNPVDALDIAIVKTKGGYHIFTSHDEFKGMNNVTVLETVRDRFETRYKYEQMVLGHNQLKANKDEFVTKLKEKYKDALRIFTVNYVGKFESCRQSLEVIDAELTNLENEINRAFEEIENICIEDQEELLQELEGIERDLNTVNQEANLVVCEINSDNQQENAQINSVTQSVSDLIVRVNGISSAINSEDTCPIECDPGQYRNPNTKKCEKLCSDGSIPESDGSCPVKECNGGLVYDSTSDSCVCPDGTTPDERGKCCKNSEFLNSFGECESKCDEFTQKWDDTKEECVDKLCPDGNPVPPGGCLPTCNDDEYWDSESCVKKCQTGGLVYDKETDGCVPPQCGSKKYWNTNTERCECTSEYTEDSSGNCIADPPVENNPDLISEFITEIDQLQTTKDTTKVESTPTSTMINGLTSIEIFGILLTYNDSDGLYHGSKDGHNVEFDPTSFIIEDVTAGGEMDVSKSDILYPETGDTSENNYEPSENTNRDDVDEPVYQEPEEEYENEDPTNSEPEVEPQEPDNSNVEEETPSTVEGPTCDHPYYCDESLWPDISSSESYVWTVINGQTGIAIWNSQTETSRYYVWVPGGWVQTTREGDAV